MRMLLLAKLHRLDRMRFICLNSQDRETSTDEDNFPKSIYLQFDFVGQVSIPVREIHGPIFGVLQGYEASLLDIYYLASVDVSYCVRLRG